MVASNIHNSAAAVGRLLLENGSSNKKKKINSNESITEMVSCEGFFPQSISKTHSQGVAFVGGIFLRLNLKEEPLKEWVSITVEASGITAEEITKSRGVHFEEEEEEKPQQIEIE